MNEDDDKQIGSGTNNLIKIILFAIVGMVIITSVAIPVLAQLGTNTTTYSNNGAKVTDIYDEYAAEISDGYTILKFESQGVYLVDSSDPTARILILKKSDFVSGYPLYIAKSLSTPYMQVVEYANGQYIKYDSGAYPGDTQETGIPASGYVSYIQDKAGEKVVCQTPLYYENISSVIGFGYYYTNISESIARVYSDGLSGSYYTYSTGDGQAYGSETSVADYTEMEDFNRLNGLSCHDLECMYYITDPVSYQITENVLEGTTVGALIGMIPMLFIIGIVVYIARNMRGSDR